MLKATFRFLSQKAYRMETLSPNAIKANYAVRGKISSRAAQIQKDLENGVSYPFKSLVQCNIGNPQVLGQKPLTWIRQVTSLLANPDLLQQAQIRNYLPADVIQRAEFLLQQMKGGIGAYSHSKGQQVIRKSISKYIEQRDGYGGVDPENIFITNGASTSVDYLFSATLYSQKDGVMIPIPQYPLYQALLDLKGASAVRYYMDSVDRKWVINLQNMQQALDQSRDTGVSCRTLVVINPGNPTGQVFSYQNMVEIVDFCQQNNLVLLADEVYQDNIYSETKKFHSFRKVILDTKSNVECVSLHSASKGFYGECGFRGGYMELHNFDQKVLDQVLKIASVNLCSSIMGQSALELIVNPPKPGSPSYEVYKTEKEKTLGALKRKAKLIENSLNSMRNIRCNQVEGAMYAFPEISFSEKAVRAAEEMGQDPDGIYCMEALEKTGIMVVPGSGFGQKPGTYHFRITSLAGEEEMVQLMKRFGEFNEEFHARYDQ